MIYPTSTEEIKSLLMTNNHAVERAILAIYHNQTKDEQLQKNTKYLNGIGFSEKDARYGSYLAAWILQGNHLSGHFLNQARKISLKYVKQLYQICLQHLKEEELYCQLEREAIQMKGN